MKEIKSGKMPDIIQRHWWAGKTVTCSRCKCEQELEASDKPIREKIERTPNGKREAWFGCPTIIPENLSAHQIRWACDGELYLMTYGLTVMG